MLKFRTFLDKSPLHGVGCFANEFIKVGSTVWQFCVIDRVFDEVTHPEIRDRCYRSAQGFIYCGDNALFLNFDNPANLYMGEETIFREHSLIAARDIYPGEELTVPPESDYDFEYKTGGKIKRSADIPGRHPGRLQKPRGPLQRGQGLDGDVTYPSPRGYSLPVDFLHGPPPAREVWVRQEDL